jgi:hypothetical protein
MNMNVTAVSPISSAHARSPWEYEALLELRKILGALREEHRRAAVIGGEASPPERSETSVVEESPDILLELARHDAELAELDGTLKRLRAASYASEE